MLHDAAAVVDGELSFGQGLLRGAVAQLFALLLENSLPRDYRCDSRHGEPFSSTSALSDELTPSFLTRSPEPCVISSRSGSCDETVAGFIRCCRRLRMKGVSPFGAFSAGGMLALLTSAA